MTNFCTFKCTMAAAAIGSFAGMPAHAAITAAFYNGTNCQGKAFATFLAGGPPITVTLCASATEEAICGHSIQLEAGNAASSGQFEIINHKMGELYSDPTLEMLPAGITITLPPSMHDFGGTRDKPQPPTKNQLFATFTLQPLSTAKESRYVIKLGKNSLVSVGKNGSCLENAEAPMAAEFTFERK